MNIKSNKSLAQILLKCLFAMALIITIGGNVNAQVTTLLDPNGDGGFENGSTFAANGWTLAQGGTTNSWFVGSVAIPMTGSNCAYISNNGFGTTYNYDVTSASTVYFYRDIAFPAGLTRITVTANWKVVGQTSFDRGFIAYCSPNSTPVNNDYMSSTPPLYATSISGNYNSWATTAGAWSTTAPSNTYYLPASFAGTTQRILVGWQNTTGGGVNPPVAFDNISITAQPGSTFQPIAAGGNWSDAATWVGGQVPSPGDNVVVPDGVTLNVDVSSSINNLTIGQGTSGVLSFTTSFTALSISGNLTVNSGGRFNGYTSSATPTAGGVQVSVAGNINISSGGTIAMGHQSCMLTLNGTSAQSINGPGNFLGNLVSRLKIVNPSSVDLNIPLTVNITFDMMAGTLNTNNNLTLDNTAQFYNTATNRQVYSIIVTNPGSGYTSAPTVTIGAPSGTGGTTATATANYDAASGKIRSITITNPGNMYRANPSISFTGGGGSGLAATVVVVQAINGAGTFTTNRTGGTTINGTINIVNSQGVGGITTLNTTANNIGYSTAPVVGFTLPARTFILSNPGSGYTSSIPTISGGTTVGSGTAPTVSAVVANGKILSITITPNTQCYSVAPTINLNGLGGTGAVAPVIDLPAATVSITNGMITGFTITNAGSGYVTAPSVALSTPVPGPTAAAAAPTCRIGLYNVNYGISSSSPTPSFIVALPVTEGAEIPSNRKLNALNVNNGGKSVTLNNDLELTAASTAYSPTSGLLLFSGANNTLWCSNPAYGGINNQSAPTATTNNTSWVVGKFKVTLPGGNATRIFPMEKHGFAIVTGTGSGGPGAANGCDITSLTGEATVGMPSGTVQSPFYFAGGSGFKLTTNVGTQFGTNPQEQIYYNADDNLQADLSSMYLGNATALTGPWTSNTSTTTASTGLIVGSGNRISVTAVTTPSGTPVALNSSVNYFTMLSNYAAPANLSYNITRTTGNTFNSIAQTGTIMTWAQTSTETAISNPVSLAGTTFQYQGAPITGFRVNIDGYMSFNTANSANYSSTNFSCGASGVTAATQVVTAFWGNVSCNSQSQVRYQVSGTLGSGNAVITVQWSNMGGSFNPQTNQGADLTWQVQLFENGNKIKFNYGKMYGFDGGDQGSWSYGCGLNGSFLNFFPNAGQALVLQEHYENTTNFSNLGCTVQNLGSNGLHTLPECYSSILFDPNLAPVAFTPGSGIPANDDAAGAFTLTETTIPPTDYCGAIYSTYGSTPSSPANGCAANTNARDVWFKFTATASTTAVKVVSSGGFDAAVQVFDNAMNAVTSCVNSTVDGRAEVVAMSGLTIGNLYYVRVFHAFIGTQATATCTLNSSGGIGTTTITNPGSGYFIISGAIFGNSTPRVTISGGGNGNATFNAITTGVQSAPGGITNLNISSPGINYTSAPTITIDPPYYGLTGDFAIAVYQNYPIPANDGICTATPLTLGSGTCNSVAGTTLGATGSNGIPTCTGNGDDDVFYSFVATTNPITVMVTPSAGMNPVLQILSASPNVCSSSLTSINCVNNTGTGLPEIVTYAAGQLTAGTTYWVRVYHSGSGAATGNFNICAFESGPPCPAMLTPIDFGTAYFGTGTTLTWSASTGATGYDVYFGASFNAVSNGLPAALVSSNQPGLSYATGALSNGTVYYWRVDARNSIGASQGCVVRQFTANSDILIGALTSVNACSNNFYDTGGPNSNYSTSETKITTICPMSAGAFAKVTFSSCVTGSGITGLSGALYVFNGNSIASPIFASAWAGGTVAGVTFPAGGYGGGIAGPVVPTVFTSTDPTGCLTFKFLSNTNTAQAGWAATVTCIAPCVSGTVTPANTASVCASNATTLSWNSVTGATGYDVYFGTNPTPTTLVSANQAGTSLAVNTSTPGTYYWKVVSQSPSGACTTPSIYSFTSLPLPNIGFSVSPNAPICTGSPVALSGTGGTSYTWNNGVTNGVPFIPTQPDYTVTGTGANGCQNTATTNLVINPTAAPTAVISGSTTICAGQPALISVLLQGTSNNVSFTLLNSVTNQTTTYSNNGSSSVTYTISVNPTQTTTYSIVSVVDNNTGCYGTFSGSCVITVNPIPVAGIASINSTASTVLCAPGGTALINLTGSTGVVSWESSSTPNGPWLTTSNSSNTTTYTTPTVTTTTYFRAILSNTSCFSVPGNTVIVYVNTGSLNVTSNFVTDASAQISWSPAAANATYDLNYTGGSLTNVTSPVTLSGLASGTSINVTVTQTNPSCGVSGATSFNTMCSAPTGLSLTLPTTYGFTATWNAVAGATGYQVYYRPMGGNVVWSSVTTNAATTTYVFGTPHLLANTSYSVYVKALGCVGGSFPTATQVVSTGIAGCGAPTSIVATSTCANQIVVTVTGGTSSVFYSFRKIYPVVGPWYGYTVASSTYTITLPGIPSGNEQYEVYAKNICSLSPLVYSFATSVQQVTTPARLAAPINVITSAPTCNGFTVSWTPVTGANGYQVNFRPVGTLVWAGYAVPNGINIFTQSYFGGGSGSYEVQVVAKGCNNLLGAASSIVIGSTLTSGCRTTASTTNNLIEQTNSLNDNSSLEVYPNPNEGTFNVSMEITGNDNAVDLQMIDMLGKIVYSSTVTVYNHYINNNLSLDNLAAGIYYLKIVENGNEYMRKVVVTK